MSKSKITLLLLILTLFVSACGGAATPTRPAATTVPSTEEATEAVAEMTEAATEEMATEEVM
ncbi:MAG: phosphate-binding protein, partial [Anaerolineae bacterium]|nr:phosphate-binding protein [Anaerolineae bacterium]